MILQGFIGPSYVGRSSNVANETLYNWYPQHVEAGEPQQVVYYARPGLAITYTLEQTPVRALFQQDGRAFAVGGNTFYELFSDGTHTARGTISFATNASPATINSSGNAGHQLYITTAGLGYIYDLNANTLVQITASGYPLQTAMGTYLDTYFLTSKGDSAQFNVSGLLDGLAWSSLDFAIRVQGSDNIVGIVQFNKLIWLIGSLTSEPWFDSGAASFPYQSVPQVLIPIGCCAQFSIVRTSGALCWLHQSERGQGIFVAASDYNPKRVSIGVRQNLVYLYSIITDAVSFAMTWLGHEFILLHFPSGNATWAFDLSEGAWSNWSWWNAASGYQERFRGWVHCQAFGGHLVGDWQNGNIYTLDPTLATDAGEPIIWERTSPHIKDDKVMMFYANFQLDTETGLGGSTPTARVNWTDDGGKTFSSEIDMTMGALGEYPTRCRAAGSLGQSRDRAFRVRISNDVPPNGITQAYVDVGRGIS